MASGVYELESRTSMFDPGVASTTCDELGQYSFPLPPIGRYLVTAFYAPTGTATAYKTLLAVDSQVIHLRLDH